MRCLTICQPFAHLIVTPQAELPRFCEQKRVENRHWYTSIRGPLLLHAGKSSAWLKRYPHGFPNLVFGAIVGVCRLVDCVEKSPVDGTFCLMTERKYPWIVTHEHAEGPFCWVLEDVRRFDLPIGYQGKQGFFDVPLHAVAQQLELCGWKERHA